MYLINNSMTMVSKTKQVQVFKINTKLNKMKHMSFRLYPKTRPVLEATVASLPAGIDILFDWPYLM